MEGTQLDGAEQLASDIVAITTLGARWQGRAPITMAEDTAGALHHLCPRLVHVGVRLRSPPAEPVEASRPRGASVTWPSTDEPERLVAADNEAIIPVGPLGRHGEILLVAPEGETLRRERLLGVLAAHQLEAACKALDLEHDIAQAHETLAALGKLSALGQLVGGVAHEVRTPLTYATTSLFTLENTLRRTHGEAVAASATPHLREIEEALDRINAIVRQLRRLARQDVARDVEEDLRDLVRDALRLWRATHVGVGSITELLHPTAPIMADRGQLQQVVLNLVQNSAEAGGPKASITVETRDDGPDVLLIVEDQGPGMPPELLGRIFEAFHTTKPDGLGLGLSIVRGIVESHHGTIRVDSSPGKGTRVEVRVPRAPRDVPS